MYDSRFWVFSAIIMFVLALFIAIPKAKASDLSANALYDLAGRLGKEYDLGDTIKTLIFVESRGGIYPVNLNDPSCGVTHININTYMRRHKIKNTNFNRNKACADLIASPEWAILNAIEELEFWKKIHCGREKCSSAQYKNVVKSYNAGWNYKGANAKEYWQKFKDAFRILKNKGIIR